MHTILLRDPTATFPTGAPSIAVIGKRTTVQEANPAALSPEYSNQSKSAGREHGRP